MNVLSIKKSLAVASIALISSSAFAMPMNDKHSEKSSMKEGYHKTNKAMAMEYNEAKFQKALTNGDMIIVDVYKDGCPVCARQHPTLEKARSIYPDAAFFKVNYAKDKKAVKKFRAGSQSTIIVFNNGKEVNRSVGQVKEAALLSQFKQAAK